MLTSSLLAAALLAALPPGLDPAVGVEFENGARFVGSEVSAEVALGGTLDVTLYYVTSTPFSPDLLAFIHVESGGDCRVVHDRPLPAPQDGVVAHRVHIPIPASCGAGLALKVQTGLYAKRDGQRVRALRPPISDSRLYAGTATTVRGSATDAAVVWDPAKLAYDDTLAARHPPWSLALGVVLALALLALARATRPMRYLALDHPRLFARLDPLFLFERLALAAVVVWSLAYTLQYATLALDTLAYPYQFEWMESGVVETVQRLADGESIYGPPTVEYVPYIYTPGYIAATWLVSLVTGVDFLAARLVSFLSILGSAWLIYRFIRRETESRPWALVGVGLLFATFTLSGRWYHLARVDSLNLLLLLLPLYVLRFRTSTRAALVAGLLMTACFMTKQAAPIAFLPPVGLLFFAEPAARRRTFLAGSVFIVTTLLSVLVANALSDGWFVYYVFEVPRQHDIVQSLYRGFWISDLATVAPLLCMSVAGIGFFAARVGRRAWFYVGLLIGFLAVAWVSRLHSGGYLNVIMPACAVLALVAPLGLGTLDAAHAAAERARWGGSPTRIGLAAFTAVQLFALGWSSGPSLPVPGDRENGVKFVEYIARIDGDVLLPDFNFIPRRAGKRSFALGMASRDLLRLESPDDRGKKALTADIAMALSERRFAQVILSEEEHLRELLMPTYCFKERLDFAPTPTTGWVIRPQWVWVPRAADTDPSATRPARPVACPHPR